MPRVTQSADPVVVQMAGPGASGSVRPRSRRRPFLTAGSLCLDFVATGSSPGGMPDATADQLSSAAGFGEWLSGPGLPAPAGGLTDDDLSSARTLRAAIAAAARRLVADESVEPADVRCINSYARRPTPVFLLRPGGRGRAVVEEVDATAALSVIARDAVHLLTSSGAGRLRACAREGCSTLFFDRSPSGRRRWCSMKGCGELVAAASYRRRRAEAAR